MLASDIQAEAGEGRQREESSQGSREFLEINSEQDSVINDVYDLHLSAVAIFDKLFADYDDPLVKFARRQTVNKGAVVINIMRVWEKKTFCRQLAGRYLKDLQAKAIFL